MKVFVAITDNDWFDQLRAMSQRQHLDEVNFWRPSGSSFRALSAGEMFLFKLHAPRQVIAGGGFFSRATRLPVALAWDAFQARNGVTNLGAFRDRIRRYKGQDEVTCIILGEPFFFAPGEEIPVPADFSRFIQTGRGYAEGDPTGANLLQAVSIRLQRAAIIDPGPAQTAIAMARYGKPQPVAPRLGQGGFRIGVLDNYRRRCAISGERTVPVLEAAHIRRYSDGGGHDLRNGLLLRSDLHRLFDLGYIAIEPNHRRVLVSPRIREEFDNGRDYYALAGRPLAEPAEPTLTPDSDFLRQHCETVYRG